jgi:hypothetical protein
MQKIKTLGYKKFKETCSAERLSANKDVSGPASTDGLAHRLLSKTVRYLSRPNLHIWSRERRKNRPIQFSRLSRCLSVCLSTLSPEDGGGSSFETSRRFVQQRADEVQEPGTPSAMRCDRMKLSVK